jgi:hypothetical protein
MSLALRSSPRISPTQFANVLTKYRSPCAPIAQECYEIVRRSGIDPAIALAFFARESVFGTRGLSAEIKNWGNVRTPFRPERAIGKHPRNFAIYATWQDSLIDWCDRINERYIRERGLDTVDKAVPVYAPASDGNAVDHYIQHINKLIAQWIAEDTNKTAPGVAPAPAPPASNDALRDELLKVTYANVNSVYRPETAMHQFALSEARAGRPLGNPISDAKQVRLNNQAFVVQVFAMDTLYAPAERPGEIRRLSDLLR